MPASMTPPVDASQFGAQNVGGFGNIGDIGMNPALFGAKLHASEWRQFFFVIGQSSVWICRHRFGRGAGLRWLELAGS